VKTRSFLNVVTVLWVVSTHFAQAVSPTPAELTESRRWVAAKFEGVVDAKSPDIGLRVLANNDAVQANGRAGRSLRIGDKQYARGLYCHAISKIVVPLPSPGKTFSAVAGVDSNEQTAGGKGSVVFAVKVGDKTAFQSPLMREGMVAVPVQVDLAGAKEFVLEIGDGGDGIGCDQADWADAKVVLADGKIVWLGELPIDGVATCTYGLEPAFSFVYDGTPSSTLLRQWEARRATRRLDDQRTERTITYADVKTGLEVRCVSVAYADFPVVEWTVYFRNTGKSKTPILKDIRALDAKIERNSNGEFLLRGNKGDFYSPESYAPYELALNPNETETFAAVGGRPTNGNFPYYNLTMPGGGIILAVGWPGQWATTFVRDAARSLQITAGQELTNLYIEPGEEIRTPLMVMLFWQGTDVLRSQNIWRRWMLAHNVPRPDGKLPPVQLAACSSHQFAEMIQANTKNQKFFINRYLEEGLKLDYWWMDAGWYIVKEPNWWCVGTWEVDTSRFSGGLRAITDHARAKGVKSIVWFEPERVMANTWIADNHPNWLLGGQKIGTDVNLLNLGNPEAWTWLTNHIDKLITEQGIDLYRQDFNLDPLGAWRANDALDRQGITENKHVVGYLAYWDELRKRHPNMLIDSCASGGRRNDLETLRRAVPLLRSDYITEPVANQGHMYGIASWIPYYGTGSGAVNAYMLRSVMCPHFTACFDMRLKDLNYKEIRRLLNQWRQFAPKYLGDYYPLTPYSLDRTAWIAWQFNCPESGDGMVQAFRRDESLYESIRVKLRGLEPNAVYMLKDLDQVGVVETTGHDLMDKGLPIAINDQPGAVVVTYKKKL
jgi:alpha-galactosidase